MAAKETAAERKFQRSKKSRHDIIARVEAAGNKITKKDKYGEVYYNGQMEGGEYGEKHGYGTYTGANKTKTTILARSRGSRTYVSGERYVGEYKNGKKDGYGIYIFPAEVMSQKDLIFASGRSSKYVGQMKDDNFHGQGTKTYANGTIVHSGEWVNDVAKEEDDY